MESGGGSGAFFFKPRRFDDSSAITFPAATLDVNSVGPNTEAGFGASFESSDIYGFEVESSSGFEESNAFDIEDSTTPGIETEDWSARAVSSFGRINKPDGSPGATSNWSSFGGIDEPDCTMKRGGGRGAFFFMLRCFDDSSAITFPAATLDVNSVGSNTEVGTTSGFGAKFESSDLSGFGVKPAYGFEVNAALGFEVTFPSGFEGWAAFDIEVSGTPGVETEDWLARAISSFGWFNTPEGTTGTTSSFGGIDEPQCTTGATSDWSCFERINKLDCTTGAISGWLSFDCDIGAVAEDVNTLEESTKDAIVEAIVVDAPFLNGLCRRPRIPSLTGVFSVSFFVTASSSKPRMTNRGTAPSFNGVDVKLSSFSSCASLSSDELRFSTLLAMKFFALIPMTGVKRNSVSAVSFGFDDVCCCCACGSDCC